MKTTATNRKIRQLIQAIQRDELLPRPEFQRRLIWTHENKNSFLDTVIHGYPFPEIYIADGDVDTETGEGKQLLVDGQQRVTTLVQYFLGSEHLHLSTVPPYAGLDENQKRAFLDYDVAVRDLGNVTKKEIIEVFSRINATNYALNEIEINNAIYTGKLKTFAEKLASNDFFENHGVFGSRDLKRMGDLRFTLLCVVTLVKGYFNRDDLLEEALAQFNDDFPDEASCSKAFEDVFAFIEECGFLSKSRIWKKSDLFTALIELTLLRNIANLTLQPSVVIERLESFYDRVESAADNSADSVAYIYYKAAVQASNDRVNRIRRGVIFNGILLNVGDAEIQARLAKI